MNVILVLCDTLRRDHLGCYGNPWIQTPNFDAMANRSVAFDNAYCASFPCMPARRDIWTGRYEFPWRGWGPLEQDDMDLPAVTTDGGALSMLITDHYHLFEHGAGNYHFQFSGWDFIRGQENDLWITDRSIEIPWPAPRFEKCHFRWEQYWRNRAHWQGEHDTMTAQVFTRAAEWLRRNRSSDPFFLLIDSFDPHEPFDPPPPYDSMYAENPPEERVRWPIYGSADRYTEQELRDIRALYAGKVTLVDRWFGRFMDTVEQLGLLDDTMIVLTTDHGHLFGEHDMIGKPGNVHGDSTMYNELAHIPLLLYHPEFRGAGRRRSQLVQLVDLYPTVLDALGIAAPDDMTLHGGSLLPLVRDQAAAIRTHAVWGKFAEGMHITDGHWTLCQPPVEESNSPLYWYSPLRPDFLKPRGIGPWDPVEKRYPTDHVRGNAQPALYDTVRDYAQQRNLIAEEPDKARDLQSALREFLNDIGAPPEQQQRLGLC